MTSWRSWFGKLLIQLLLTFLKTGLISIFSKQWQSDINCKGSDENWRSGGWLLDFLHNVCTQYLKDGIKDSFKRLEPFDKGGVTNLYLILLYMLYMAINAVAVLKSVHKVWQT